LIEKEITIVNRLGLHARPSALVVQTASRYKSEIKLKKADLEVNAKSIIGVMMLAAEIGSKIVILAQGEDEAQAVEALVKLFEDKFGEE
jgi:phosphocarrier protein HPr